MTDEYQIRVLPEIAADEQRIKTYLSMEKGIDPKYITAIRILKKSIDARQRTIYVNLKVRTYVNEEPDNEKYVHTVYNPVDGKPQVIVVGEGPAGLFASLRLIELGLRPIIIERGKNVHERKKDIALIGKNQIIDSESNYAFGEGGAGAYSDGKLYTRSKKRGNVDKILNVFCQHGASTDILVDAHPHIGTDKLPRIIENMRNTIISCGGEVHFQTRMSGFIIKNKKVIGIETSDGRIWTGPVILATGHSARDVYRWFSDNHILIEAKGIAVGVRLEHPSDLIDRIQYHSNEGRGKYLPPAEYNYVTQINGRGVYSFCMCPGGFVIPAASGPEQIVVNGMSPSNRGSKWSNSGMVVEIHPEDIPAMKFVSEKVDPVPSELAVMQFQEQLERQCWLQGGEKQIAPAQRMYDFTRRKMSNELPRSSYSAGIVSSPLHSWLPDFISSRLIEGFKIFNRHSQGFLTNQAVLIGVETRTSSPVRILRDNDTLQHPTLKGLFPCGEGAGYAGGIVSAGIDGEKCAESVATYLN